MGAEAWPSAATGFLVDAQTMADAHELAEFTVEHVRAASGARWAEVVRTNPSDGSLVTLAATDADITSALQDCRAVAGEPPAPGDPRLPGTIVLDDLTVASPWPRFGAMAATRTPVRSAVLPYVRVQETAVVVPVYDDRPGFFTPPRRQYVELVAQLAGMLLTRLAMADALGHLRTAMSSRQHIGNAVGVLIARRGLSPDAAFQLLRTTSSRRHRKLRDIATDVLRDGELPDTEP